MIFVFYSKFIVLFIHLNSLSANCPCVIIQNQELRKKYSCSLLVLR